MASFASRVLDPPLEDNQTKEVGLQLLEILVDTVEDLLSPSSGISAADLEAILKGPLSELKSTAETLGSMSLYSDWAPPKEVHEVTVDVDVSSATADSVCQDPKSSASHAVDGQTSTFWRSENSRRSSTWSVKVKEMTHVTSMLVVWKQVNSAPAIPASVNVEVSTDDGKSWTTVNTVVLADVLPAEAFNTSKAPSTSDLTARISVGASATHLRLCMEGACKGNGSGCHALQSVSINMQDFQSVHVGTKSTLATLQRLLFSSLKIGSLSGPTKQIAHAGLQNLALSSGALGPLLSLVDALIASPPGESLDLDNYRDFIKELQCLSGNEVETKMGGGVSSTAPEFDSDCKSSNFSISGDKTTVTSQSSSKNYVYGTVGFKSGKAAWEFTSVTDSHGDECLTYGCGTKPVNSGSYDSSSNLWMIRCYNGSVYPARSGRSSTSKIHVGDVVRFELDCDAGTVTCKINGADQGVVFTGLEGKEVFPAVCSYGDGRTCKFLSIETSDGFGDSSKVLSSLTPQSSSGHYVNEGKLESDIDISVRGKSCGNGISLWPFPSTSEASTVTYNFSEAATPPEAIVGELAVDDSSPENAQPVIVEILHSDGTTVLYKSRPMHTAGTSTFFRVFLDPDYPEVTISARFENPSEESSLPAAKTVLLNALAVDSRDWSWLKKRSPGTFKDLPAAPSPLDLAAGILDSLVELIAVNMNSMSNALVAAGRIAQAEGKPDLRDVDTAAELSQLESPFCIDVCATTFVQLQALLQTVFSKISADPDAKAGSGEAPSDVESPLQSIAFVLLQLIQVNLRRLDLSKVDPAVVGINCGKVEDAPLTLSALHNTLQDIMDSPSMPTALQIAAADATDSGLSILYPTPEERLTLMSSLISKGGVVEVQFKFPTYKVEKKSGSSSKSGTLVERDPRYDRALLLLQTVSEAKGFECRLEGTWEKHVYLLISLPQNKSGVALDFLSKDIASAFSRAGFSDWEFPIGCSDPLIRLKIERYITPDDTSRNFTDDGLGFVRIYPHSAARSLTDSDGKSLPDMVLESVRSSLESQSEIAKPESESSE